MTKLPRFAIVIKHHPTSFRDLCHLVERTMHSVGHIGEKEGVGAWMGACFIHPSSDHGLYRSRNLGDECATHQKETYSYPQMTPLLDDKGHNIGYNIVEIR